MTIQPDSEHPIAEAVRETGLSWRQTPAWGKALLGLGLLAFLGLCLPIVPAHPNALLPLLRTLALAAVMAGTVVNARTADPFFRQVYLEGCAFAVLVSAVLLFGAAQFRFDLAENAVTLLLLTWLAGVAISFVRLRRA
jgi:hypothetical protein